jgi:hypothetical protein
MSATKKMMICTSSEVLLSADLTADNILWGYFIIHCEYAIYPLLTIIILRDHD